MGHPVCSITGSLLPSQLPVETEREKELVQLLKQATDRERQLQSELDDFNQFLTQRPDLQKELELEKEMKQRNSRHKRNVSICCLKTINCL